MELSEITNAKDARRFIKEEAEGHLTSGNPTVRHLSYHLVILSTQTGGGKYSELSRTRDIGLAYAVDSMVRESRFTSFMFTPLIFLILKFDLFSSDDPEITHGVCYRLLKVLDYLFALPDDALTISILKRHKTYILFLEYVQTLTKLLGDRSVTETVPYSALVADYESKQREIRQGLVTRLLPSLKIELSEHDNNSYEDKLNLVRWLNAELRRFDLSIKSPVTGRPAILSADSNGKQGRFKIKSEDDDGQMTTLNIAKLPELLEKLELMDTPERREPLREWRERVTRTNDGFKRN